MSSRFSEDKVHQLQMSMRHASRSPPTRRGGHLPPPTLILSIPITLAFVSYAGSRSTEHMPPESSRFVSENNLRVTRAFCETWSARNPTPWNAILIGRQSKFHVMSLTHASPLSGTVSRDNHLKIVYLGTLGGRAPIYATGTGSDTTPEFR